MNLAEEAFQELYPTIKEDRTILVSYSGKFKSLNANVKYNRSKIHFSLSKDWLEYSEDIRKGLIQSLLIKVLKHKYTKTLELDLYYKFLNNLGRYAKVEHADPILEESFNRINKTYFSGSMEKPNLIWGQDAFRKLGHYEYASNTVLISNIFKKNTELLDYIMYHELLHKKHGNRTTKTGRTIHHSRAFKEEEKQFLDKEAEKKLTAFIRKERVRNAFKFW